MASGIGAAAGGGFALPTMPAFDGVGGAKRAGAGAGTQSTEGAEGAGGASFADLLANKVEGLNAQQNASGELTQDLAAGRVDDIAQTMMRIEEASVSLRMATQVRNKAIDAYQEVLRMQI